VAKKTAKKKKAERESNALDLKQGVFAQRDPKAIARSLKRSAEHSTRRKSSPYRSAMSMLTFYINRAGKDLPASARRCWTRPRTNCGVFPQKGDLTILPDQYVGGQDFCPLPPLSAVRIRLSVSSRRVADGGRRRISCNLPAMLAHTRP